MSLHVTQPNITPLIQQLAKDKAIEQGLLVASNFFDVKHWTDAWPGQWQQQDLWSLATLPFKQRFDLAVIILDQASLITHPLEEKNITNHCITHGLTHLRDLLAKRILVVVQGEQSALLRPLGFSQIETVQAWTFWQFNILDYKQVPDWLNSKYWANPENWGKYRW